MGKNARGSRPLISIQHKPPNAKRNNTKQNTDRAVANVFKLFMFQRSSSSAVLGQHGWTSCGRDRRIFELRPVRSLEPRSAAELRDHHARWAAHYGAMAAREAATDGATATMAAFSQTAAEAPAAASRTAAEAPAAASRTAAEAPALGAERYVKPQPPAPAQSAQPPARSDSRHFLLTYQEDRIAFWEAAYLEAEDKPGGGCRRARSPSHDD